VYGVLSPDTPTAALLSQMRINPAATIKTYKLSKSSYPNKSAHRLH